MAVSATFAGIMLPNLTEDPNVQTQALLHAILVNSETSNPANAVLAPAPWTGPSRTTIWIQCLLYISLACSLLAALGAVLGKQWLNYYNGISVRGSIEGRGMDRQRKLDSLKKWRFNEILEGLPILLQLSLFLFTVSLSAFIYDLQPIVGVVLITPIGIGTLFYIAVVVAPLFFPDCPFHTSLSDALARWLEVSGGLYGNVVKITMQTVEAGDKSRQVQPYPRPLKIWSRLIQHTHHLQLTPTLQHLSLLLLRQILTARQRELWRGSWRSPATPSFSPMLFKLSQSSTGRKASTHFLWTSWTDC